MASLNDTVLSEFIEDAREHLASAESDLLEAEGGAEHAETASKILDSVRYLKGASSLFGLRGFKRLSGRMELVLELVRGEALALEKEAVDALLASVDRLGELLELEAAGDSVEPGAAEDRLEELLVLNLPMDDLNRAARTRTVSHHERELFEIAEIILDVTESGFGTLYLLRFDLIADVHRKGLTPLSLIRKMSEAGQIIDCKIDIEAVGGLADSASRNIPLYVLFASNLDKSAIAATLDIATKDLWSVQELFGNDSGGSARRSGSDGRNKESGKAILPGEGSIDVEDLDAMEKAFDLAMQGKGRGNEVSTEDEEPVSVESVTADTDSEPEETVLRDIPAAADPVSAPEPDRGGEDVEMFGKIKVDRSSPETVITLPANVTVEVAVPLRDAVLSALNRSDTVAVDMSSVERLDITMLQVLVAAQKSAGSRGKTIQRVGDISGTVDRCARMAGLDEERMRLEEIEAGLFLKA